MFTREEKLALENIKQIDNIETRMSSLIRDIKENMRYPREIFDTYARHVKYDLEKREKALRK